MKRLSAGVATPPGARPTNPPRIDALDACRGLALLMMAGYHLAFDLNHFGLWRQDFYQDSFWLSARTLILSSFLFLAGLSLDLTDRRPQALRHFSLRLLRIGAAAGLVSLGSTLFFPQSWIYFGVLHFLFLASVIAWPLRRLGTWNFALGAFCLILGNSLRFPIFAAPSLHWLGFAPAKPFTEDYVPLLPWLGVLLFGMASAPFLVPKLTSWYAAAPSWLAWLGRHSLAFYLLHQPVFFGLLTATTAWR